MKASPFGRGGDVVDGEGLMQKPKLKKNSNLLNLAKTLRRNMTKQERRLWYDFLQKYPIKIYKQRIIGNFIADFYCHKCKLVIETDGSQHYTDEGQVNDKARTKVFEQYGVSVLRFSNREVEENFEGVCCLIDKTIQDKIIALN